MTTTGASSANDRPLPNKAERRTPAFLTDFDDTAAVQNVAELLLNRFGAANWTDVRQAFRDGKMSLKEYQEITFREIEADRPAMQHYVREHATLRPWFPELRRFCLSKGIPLAVVSQGLDFYIFSPAGTRRLRRRAHICRGYELSGRPYFVPLQSHLSRQGSARQFKGFCGRRISAARLLCRLRWRWSV